MSPRFLHQRLRHVGKLLRFITGGQAFAPSAYRAVDGALRPFEGWLHPGVRYAYFRSFISNSFSIARKREVLLYHYRYLSAQFPAPFLEKLHGGGLTLYTRDLPEGRLSFLLRGTAAAYFREGALTLELLLGDQLLCVATFTVGPVAVGGGQVPALIVSGLQSIRSGLPQLAAVMRALHGVAARKVMLHALAGIAEGWRLPGLLGIRTEDHVEYRNIRNRPSFDKSYTGFWTEQAGHQVHPEGFWLSLPLGAQPAGGRQHRHPGRKRRRTEVLTQIGADLCVASARWQAPPVPGR